MDRIFRILLLSLCFFIEVEEAFAYDISNSGRSAPRGNSFESARNFQSKNQIYKIKEIQFNIDIGCEQFLFSLASQKRQRKMKKGKVHEIEFNIIVDDFLSDSSEEDDTDSDENAVEVETAEEDSEDSDDDAEEAEDDVSDDEDGEKDDEEDDDDTAEKDEEGNDEEVDEEGEKAFGSVQENEYAYSGRQQIEMVPMPLYTASGVPPLAQSNTLVQSNPVAIGMPVPNIQRRVVRYGVEDGAEEDEYENGDEDSEDFDDSEDRGYDEDDENDEEMEDSDDSEEYEQGERSNGNNYSRKSSNNGVNDQEVVKETIEYLKTLGVIDESKLDSLVFGDTMDGVCLLCGRPGIVHKIGGQAAYGICTSCMGRAVSMRESGVSQSGFVGVGGIGGAAGRFGGSEQHGSTRGGWHNSGNGFSDGYNSSENGMGGRGYGGNKSGDVLGNMESAFEHGISDAIGGLFNKDSSSYESNSRKNHRAFEVSSSNEIPPGYMIDSATGQLVPSPNMAAGSAVGYAGMNSGQIIMNSNGQMISAGTSALSTAANPIAGVQAGGASPVGASGVQTGSILPIGAAAGLANGANSGQMVMNANGQMVPIGSPTLAEAPYGYVRDSTGKLVPAKSLSEGLSGVKTNELSSTIAAVGSLVPGKAGTAVGNAANTVGAISTIASGAMSGLANIVGAAKSVAGSSAQNVNNVTGNGVVNNNTSSTAASSANPVGNAANSHAVNQMKSNSEADDLAKNAREAADLAKSELDGAKKDLEEAKAKAQGTTGRAQKKAQSMQKKAQATVDRLKSEYDKLEAKVKQLQQTASAQKS